MIALTFHRKVSIPKTLELAAFFMSATEFLFGEEIARASSKQLLKEKHRVADAILTQLRTAKQEGHSGVYFQKLYQVLQRTYPYINAYPKANRRIIYYCLKNFPQKGFIIEPDLQHWYGAKLRLSKFRRFRRGKYQRRYRRRRLFRRYRKTFRRFNRRYRRRYNRRRRYYRRRY